MNKALLDYELLITARHEAEALKHTEESFSDAVSPTQLTLLSPGSFAKREKEWEDIYEAERRLTIRSNSNLSIVTETDVDSDCESEYAHPISPLVRPGLTVCFIFIP